MKPVLLDSGALVAMFDRDEQHHSICRELVEQIDSPLVTCEAVIVESCYLLRRIKQAPQRVLENVAAGTFQLPFQLSSAAVELVKILTKYSDRQIDLADACLIHLANELATGDILTLDRDFRVYRWGRNQPFNMLVPLR